MRTCSTPAWICLRLIRLDDDMRIRASSAERTYSSSFRNRWSHRPIAKGALNEEGRVVPINIGVQLLGMQRRHEPSVLHLQDDFDQSGNSGSSFQMPDIRFH